MYITGLKIPVTDAIDKAALKDLFAKSPLLIIKNPDILSPDEFIDFLTIFDADCDRDAIDNPGAYPERLLQPFDHLPCSPHVSPRGHFKQNNLFGMAEISGISQYPYIEKYVWHTDLLGHPTKLPPRVTGFHVVEQPLIGGETDFICGNTVYNNLPPAIKTASENIVYEVNRKTFLSDAKKFDYSGTIKLQDADQSLMEDTVALPLVFGGDGIRSPCVLLQSSFFEKVQGWGYNESNTWLKEYMRDYVLPHRISIQWKKGDIGVCNNRRFIHSSTPSKRYTDYTESSTRLLLQTFLPTTAPLKYLSHPELDEAVHFRVGWTTTVEASRAAGHATRAFYSSLSK